jgi:hypothetical protein
VEILENLGLTHLHRIGANEREFWEVTLVGAFFVEE